MLVLLLLLLLKTFKLCPFFFGKKHQYFNFFLSIFDLRQSMRDARQFTHDPRNTPIRISQMTQRSSLRLNYYTTFKLIFNSLKV